jgi:hypothetical protein
MKTIYFCSQTRISLSKPGWDADKQSPPIASREISLSFRNIQEKKKEIKEIVIAGGRSQTEMRSARPIKLLPKRTYKTVHTGEVKKNIEK